MNKHFIAAVVCLLIPFGVAQANDDFTLEDLGEVHQGKVDPKDPCTILMCMGGVLEGSLDKECKPSVDYFYSLKKFGRHGFDPWETFKKRRGKLDSCPSGDDVIKSKVLDAFGRLRG